MLYADCGASFFDKRFGTISTACLLIGELRLKSSCAASRFLRVDRCLKAVFGAGDGVFDHVLGDGAKVHI